MGRHGHAGQIFLTQKGDNALTREKLIWEFIPIYVIIEIEGG